MQIPLVNDPTFQQFLELLKGEPDTTVRSTLVGRFFYGTKETLDTGTFWRGFGHLGCCTLLVIQRVESFEPHRRTDCFVFATHSSSDCNLTLTPKSTALGCEDHHLPSMLVRTAVTIRDPRARDGHLDRTSGSAGHDIQRR